MCSDINTLSNVCVLFCWIFYKWQQTKCKFCTKKWPHSSFSIILLPHCGCMNWGINTLRPTQNGCHYADDTFKCIFLNENFKFKWNFINICSLWSNWQYGSIGSDNGLAPNRRQAIIWTNVGMFYWRINASLGLKGLMPVCGVCCLKALQPQSKTDWY